MSTHIYPITEPVCLYIDDKLTTLILIKQAEKDQTLQPEIKDLITKYGITKVVNEYLIPKELIDEYQDTMFAMEILTDELANVVWASNFEGTITTKWPETCIDNNTIDITIEDEFLLYIVPKKEIDYFSQAYKDHKELYDEFYDTLSEYLPENFSLWEYIVSVDGTYYC